MCTNRCTKLILFTIGFVTAGIVIALNAKLAERLAPPVNIDLLEGEFNPASLKKILTVLIAGITIFLAILFGVALSSSWEVILLWYNGMPFNIEDAQFGRDLSFYMFDLPFFRFIQGWITWLVIIENVKVKIILTKSESLFTLIFFI